MKYRTFDEWFDDFVRYNEDGHVKCNYVTPEGYKLGIWVYSIRQGKYKLTEEQKRRLMEVGFVCEIFSKRKFEEWFADFVRYNEDGNVKRNFVTPEGYRLGKWVNCIRQGNYKLTKEQKRQLTEAGFVWKIFSQRKFEEWFADYVRYNEDGNVKFNFVTPEGYRLGIWVSRIRTGCDKLTEEQKRLLTEAGFVWKKFSPRKFEEWFDDFVRYNEDGNVKRNFVTPEGYRLGNWVKEIRYGSYKLTEEQKRQLTEVGFVWKKIRKFEDWFADYVRYNEDGNVKQNFVTPEGYRLGNWVNRIRTGCDKLTEEQKRQLKEAGFRWHSNVV